jgi:menaquinone-9 beta-reductase
MLRVQRAVPRVPPRLLALALRGMSSDAFVRWSFGHYLNIAPPEFAAAAPQRAAVPAEALAA